MLLDTRLGTWFSVPRTTWRTATRTNDTLYWREGATIYSFTPTKLKGFYLESGTVQNCPSDSHPILGQRVGPDLLWSHRHYYPDPTPPETILPPGLILDNTIENTEAPNVFAGSDGSLHREHRVATCAWMIQVCPTQTVRACLCISGITSLSSYWSKLEGIYRFLFHIRHLGLTPSTIQH